jgi:outer membrane protein TolC
MQARSQYETAAATIPQIESQIAQTENALSTLLARNPGPIDRGKSISDLVLPAIGRTPPKAGFGGPALIFRAASWRAAATLYP